MQSEPKAVEGSGSRPASAGDGRMPGSAQFRNYVAGSWRTGSRTLANINPADGCRIGDIFEADEELVTLAVTAARQALAGAWGRTTLEARCRLLEAIAQGIDDRFDEFVAAEVRDTGRTVQQARTLDVPRAAQNFRSYASVLRTAGTECFETATPDGRGALNYVIRRPVGVVAAIVPWNLPLLLLSWKVAPALGAGNAVIAKPSDETPSTATLLAEVMDQVGVPQGAFGLLHGGGVGSTGERLVRNPGVDAITFTGGTHTGRTIMRHAAERVKRISLELGGKNAAVVFADADLDAAIEGTLRSAFSNSGQVCLCTERIYVERTIFEAFIGQLVVRTGGLKSGFPDVPETSLGPLISARQRERVLGYVDLARQDGGIIHVGGAIPSFGDERDQGFYFEPTVVSGLPPGSRFNQEEVFGPICHVAPFDDEEQAVALANSTDFGLAAVLWTSELSRAHRVAARLRAGIVWVNDWYLRDLRTPFGGLGQSGLGREGGRYSLEFFTEPTNVCIRL